MSGRDALPHCWSWRRSLFFRIRRRWLRRPDVFEIDPNLQLVGGESYPANAAGVFRIFLDSSPDRWGRVLLERRELMRAGLEGRAARALGEWDFLFGVQDTARMGALRYRKTADGPFLDNDEHHAAPPLATLRELEATALSLEDPNAQDLPQYNAWLTALLAPGSSLGGHRPKANFTDTDESLWKWLVVLTTIRTQSGCAVSTSVGTPGDLRPALVCV